MNGSPPTTDHSKDEASPTLLPYAKSSNSIVYNLVTNSEESTMRVDAKHDVAFKYSKTRCANRLRSFILKMATEKSAHEEIIHQ